MPLSEETKEDATLFLIVCVEILSVPETRFCDKRLNWQRHWLLLTKESPGSMSVSSP